MAASTVSLQASIAFAIVPHNTNDLTETARGIYVGGEGDLKVDMAESGTVTFSAVPAGTCLPIHVKRVYATGTTATLILGLQ